MDRKHVIGEAVFDISFASEEVARQLGQDMDHFIQHRLLPDADEAFGEFATRGAVTRIDQLEVDLGDISGSDFHAEMTDRFGERLRSALQEKLQAISQAPIGSEGIFSLQHVGFEELRYFLETGRKRGDGGGEAGRSMEELLGDALSHQGRAFAEFLKTTPRREAVLRRLSKQFSEDALVEVLALLAPAHAGFFAERLRDADAIPDNTALDMSKADGRRMVFERLFHAFLGDADKLPEPEMLFEEVTARPRSPGGYDRKAGTQAETDTAPSAGDGEVADHPAPEGLLRTRLEETLATGRSSGVETEWSGLLRDHAAMVRDVFAQRLGDASLRQRLAAGFPESMLLDLVSVLRPADADFIGAVLQQPEWRGGETDGKPVALWSYTLSWLHVSGESGSDRVAYVRGQVAELEATGIGRAEVLHAVGRVDADVVRELESESPAVEDRAQALLERLKGRLSGNSTVEAVDEIAELSTMHAEQLARFLERMPADGLDRLGAGELRALAVFLIRQNGQERSGDFLREVERQASGARSETGYYYFVLHKLLQGEAVDLLEAAGQGDVEGTNAEPGSGVQDDVNAETDTGILLPPEDGEVSTADHLSPEALLRMRLEEALATGRTSGIEKEWGELLRSHTAVVREVFAQRLGDAVLQQRLAAGFPELMLLELLGVLQPGEAEFIEEVLRQPELPREEAGGKSIRFWEYTLSWMHAAASSGGSRADYVLGLLAELEGADVGRVEVLHAERLARFLEQEPDDGLDRLEADELRTLAVFLIEQSGPGQSDEILREVERQASEAGSEAGYYRHILQSLLRGEAVDLLQGTGQGLAGLLPEDEAWAPVGRSEAPDGESESAAHGNADVVLSPEELVRGRLEEALVTGRSSVITKEWDELLLDHAAMVREVFAQRLGDASLQQRLATGFPEPMLLDLVGVLLPGEVDFIGELFLQPELRGEEPDQTPLALWKYALSWLHASLGSGAGRADFIRGLTAELEADGIGRAEVLRAVERIDAGLLRGPGSGLSGEADAAPERAQDLLKRLADRLSGNSPAEVAEEIDALSTRHAKWLALFLEKWAGQASVEALDRLTAGELRALVVFLIGQKGQGRSGDFLGSVESQASGARSEAGYYRHILQGLLRGEAVDLVLAAEQVSGGVAAPEAGMPDEAAERIGREHEPGEQAPSPEDIVRMRLEEALVTGRAPVIGKEWAELLRDHAVMVREVFAQRLGDASLQQRLAVGFPEPMLLGLIGALKPDEAVFIGELLQQAELRPAEQQPGEADDKPVSLWAYTLSWLHAAGDSEDGRADYVRRLMAEGISGVGRTGVLRAVERIDADVLRDLESEASGEADRAQQLLERLKDRLSGDGTAELVQEIGELSARHAEQLVGFLELETGEGLGRLEAGELRALAVFLIKRNGQGQAGDFLREIERQASGAGSEAGYYRHILQSLLRGEVVDLNEAAEREITGPASEEDVRESEAQTLAVDRAEGLLRIRLEEALVSGRPSVIEREWIGLLRSHASMLREVFVRRLGDASSQQRLAAGFPEPMLLELLGVLHPADADFIGSVLKQPELRPEGTPVEAWSYTLSWLHAVGLSGGDRTAYASGLMDEMEAAGIGRAEVLRAVECIDADVVRELKSEASGEAGEDRAQAMLERLKGRLAGTETVGVSQEIEELSTVYAEQLARFLEQVPADGLDRLEAGELQALATFLIKRNGQGNSGDFLREVERQATGAKSAAGYYRYVLQQLLRGEVVDLLTATEQGIAGSQSEGAAGIGDVAPERVLVLLDRLAGRLAGVERFGISQEIEELSTLRAQELARFLEEMHTDGLDRLDAGELRALAVFLIKRNGQGSSGDFLREVERQAPGAGSEAGYYRHILQGLLRGEAVDLVQATGQELAGVLPGDGARASEGSSEAPDRERESADHGGAAAERMRKSGVPDEAAGEREPESKALTPEGLVRMRLEEALVTGRALVIEKEWSGLLRDHAAMVREVFAQRLGDASLQLRLAEGFPEPMLRGLLGALRPVDAPFIGALLQQPELRAAESDQMPVALWRYTLSWLHAAGDSESGRADYVRGLLAELEGAGVGRAEVLRAVGRIDTGVLRELDTALPDDAPGEQDTAPERVRALLKRLEDRLSGAGTAGVAQEIEALSILHAAGLDRLLEGQSSGEGLDRLEAGELRALAVFLIEQNGHGWSGGFLREVESRALGARSEAAYYRYILRHLLRDEAVDLAEAAEQGIDGVQPEGDAHEAESRPEAGQGVRETAEERSRRDEIPKDLGEIYITNAGMVLMVPYLPRLFDMLELTGDGAFRGEGAPERAMHLIQFAVNESSDSPEFLLALNKILCGIAIEKPVIRGIDLLSSEQEAIEGMLTALIRNWSIIGNTSIQGLRESFLQRSGRLLFRDEAWHLLVEKKGIDVLLDQLPWSYAIVKYPWMAWPVHVQWR